MLVSHWLAADAQVKQLQAENIDLVQRLVSYKALDAELLNKDNENFRKSVLSISIDFIDIRFNLAQLTIRKSS